MTNYTWETVWSYRKLNDDGKPYLCKLFFFAGSVRYDGYWMNATDNFWMVPRVNPWLYEI